MKGSFFCYFSLVVLLGFGLGSCGLMNPSDPPSVPEAEEEEWDKTLTFNDVTLEQVNAKGQMVWKVRSPVARYNDDQKITEVETPTGELFQDGKLVYSIEAKRGQVYDDGKKIVLQEDIVATDMQSNAVLRGHELEWLPEADLLVVRRSLTGTHSQVDVSANEARVQSRQQRMELIGNAIATTKEPVLQLRSEHVVWQMDRQVVTGDRPVTIERYPCESPQACAATDVAVGDRAEVNLKTQIAQLQDNAELTLSDPPLTVNSDAMVWDVQGKTVTSDTRVTAIHRQKQFIFSGDRGKLELDPQIFFLSGTVTGKGGDRLSDLKADRVTWWIPTEEFEAEGNVLYRQADPPLTLSGPKAFGVLQNQTVKFSGGNVVTEVIPSSNPE
ncbi:LPS export ABC transporter periplasmic protein LptC [Phormidium sp. CCY1219]|uniref:LPS export ABC transporter periplasmic protein LptC n=1 Tax=Phormidium sp. CCY1219 TaxID=2886104 RepID=UPI002D1E65EB|nr:LPS export ABC transporter periplasmic protein LptC [Phormidium sp. CCY1219]MEB3829021.1 LPS export ABC transporter periplasmic protein LptC [Phormidium sp. CCY1219]